LRYHGLTCDIENIPRAVDLSQELSIDLRPTPALGSGQVRNRGTQMTADIYNFQEIPPGATVYRDRVERANHGTEAVEVDLVSKSALYWGKALDCRFQVRSVGKGVEITRLPRLYKDRRSIDFSKIRKGDEFDVVAPDPNAMATYVRYHAGREGLAVETARRLEGTRLVLTVRVVERKLDKRRVPAYS
jgi:hypothetical protein